MAGTELQLPEHVLDYLEAHKALTLATASASGVPRATTLLYVNRGATLYLWVRPESRTAKHVEQNSFVSFTIDEYSDNWRETKGIQGNGECSVVLSGQDIARAAMLFGEKFPSAGRGSTTVGIYFLKITPSQLQFIDNSRSKDESPTEEFGVHYQRENVLDVFGDLPQDAEAAFESQLQSIEVAAGDVIAREGAPADKLLIVVDGEVDLLRDEQKVGSLGAGQIYGEIGIMRDRPRTASLKAATDARLLAIDRDVWHTLVGRSLGTGQDLGAIIGSRYDSLGG